MAEEWTEATCIQLIKEYRARPILWDLKDPYFYKQQMKPEAWESIGRALNMHADTCKHKMEILMSSFRREKFKIRRSLRKGGKVYKSAWFALKEMSFLMKRYEEIEKKRHRKPNYINDDTLLQLMTESDSHIKQPSTKETNYAHEKDLASMDLQTGDSVIVPQIVSNAETEEEIKSFTNFIAMKMKKYSEKTKNAVQQAICDIIFQADQNLAVNNMVVNSSCSSQPYLLHKTADSDADDRIVIKKNYSDSD